MKTLYFLLIGLLMACNNTSHPSSQKEKNLRINIRKEPASLDPRKGCDIAASQLHFMLFEGLMRLGPDMTLSAAQAESYELSPDGKTYTFHMRGSKWSNGELVTADDFERSWKTILDPRFPCPDAYLLYSIKNAKRAKKGEVPLQEVGIRAKDPKTLIVELEQPSPHFLQIVASSVLLPVSPSIEDRHSKEFISNGPFRLTEWKFNGGMTFEKNPFYRRRDNVQLDHVFIEILDNEVAVFQLYETGYYDLICAPLSFFPSRIRQDPVRKRQLNFFPVATTKFIAFNTSSYPFNNVHMRRAFVDCIQRKEIVAHITQLNEKEALNVIPPALMDGLSADLCSDGDETRAKESLKLGLQELNLRHRDLKNLTFVYCASDINQSIAQFLQDRWLKVLGVSVRLESVEFKILHERSKSGEFSMALFAWMADYADPMNILERFTDKTNHRNYPKWDNAAYNSLLEEASKSRSAAGYWTKVQQAEHLILEEVPLTCLYHENFVFLAHPYVQGIAVSPLGHIYFEEIKLSSRP